MIRRWSCREGNRDRIGALVPAGIAPPRVPGPAGEEVILEVQGLAASASRMVFVPGLFRDPTAEGSDGLAGGRLAVGPESRGAASWLGIADPVPRNELLAALPPADVERLIARFRRVTLVLNQVLHEPGGIIEDVYFVEEGLVSLTADTGDNGFVEVGTTGRDGLVGTPVLLSPDAIAVHRALVQMPGVAFRVGSASFRDMVEQSFGLRDRCLRYLYVTMVQTAQSAACNARHALPGRLARWILMCHDRASGDELPMKQEFLSSMLGVRRAGVSVAVNALQSRGVIRQCRGRLVVLDRAGLEAEACPCYRLAEDCRRRIMGTPK
jgi:CRP-like cAMP-binding protein